jgi:branched-chain amino acid transport system substrate-binding protein
MHRLFAAPFLVFAACLAQLAAAEIRIGAPGPITGRLAWIGEQGQRGVEVAVAHINAQGGVLGQELQLLTADDFCDVEQAVAAASAIAAEMARIDDALTALKGISLGSAPASSERRDSCWWACCR